MKITVCRPALVRLVFACSCLGVCLPVSAASTRSTPHVLGKKGEDDAPDKKESTKPPFNGMTKAQATKAYGEPDSVGHRDGEELWTYVLNRGESYGKSFIPFAPVTKFRYRLLTFRDGKVVKFRWDAPEKN